MLAEAGRAARAHALTHRPPRTSPNQDWILARSCGRSFCLGGGGGLTVRIVLLLLFSCVCVYVHVYMYTFSVHIYIYTHMHTPTVPV